MKDKIMPKFKEITPNFSYEDPKDPNVGIFKIDTEEWEVVEISMHFISKQLTLKMREKQVRKRKRGPKGKYQPGWTK